MEWIEVLQRIQAGESEHTELGRFRSFADKDWQKAVCAFANAEGGVVVLGVSDDGAIDGVPMDPEQVQEQLSNALHNTLNAPIQARLGYHRDPNGWVHWIEVARMRGPEPLRHKGRVLVRRGRANDEPSASELQELYNTFGLVFTEDRVVPGTGADDIDPDVFRAYMQRKGVDLDAEPRLPLEVDLFNREILDRDFNGNLRATLYGLLCFGKSPQQFSPTRNLWVDLVVYAGTDRGDEVLLAGEARGRLDEQVERAQAWLKGLGRNERYAGVQRADLWLVPIAAFRECVVNAVAHRDYAILGSRVLVEVFDDRVVVTSPGALPNHKRPESVLAGGTPRSRNESMANFLLDKGLMEQRGSGYPRIARAMREFNGTAPRLEHDREERWVKVTLWRITPVDIASDSSTASVSSSR
jgi:ATP-dependent DNA helicase RecG